MIVTYWPSTQPSIKKQVHPVEDIGVSPWPVDGLNSVQLRRPQEAGIRKQLYNPAPQTVWVCWRQLQLEFELQFEAVRTSSRQRACGPQWPPVELPCRMRKKCCYSQRNLGSICCSLFRLQLTSHTTLSRIKCERYIFFKEACLFVIIVDYVSAYICIRIVVSRLCNKKSNLQRLICH